MITALILNTFFLLTPLERPEIVVSQSFVEARHNVKAKGKAGEQGAFQVLPNEWGKVPKTWKKQADQNERIMNELIQENKGDIQKSISGYNSYKNKKKGKVYLAKVRKHAISVYILDVA